MLHTPAMTLGRSAFLPQGVVSDGANDHLSRGAQYTNAADSKLFTFAMQVMLTGAAADQHIISGFVTTTARYVVGRSSSDEIYVRLRNTSGSDRVVVNSSALSTGTWYAVLGSFDSANTSNRHLYINDASDLTATTYTDSTLDFTMTLNTIFTRASSAGAANWFAGEVAELWFDFGRYVDFSVTANRRLFFTSDHRAVFKGADGSLPFGAAPIGYFSGAASSFPTNLGSGGGMTLTGTLGDSSTDPLGT